MSWPQIIIIPKIFRHFLACKIALAANHHYPEKIQRLFRLQNCLRSKSSSSWKYSKIFCRQKCLRRKSSLSWNYSKIFSPAKTSSTQIIIILKIFNNFFACKIVFDANHHYHGNIQRFFSCKIVLAANHHHPEKIQKLFRPQICRRRKSSLSWNYSKIFSPAKLS